MTKDDFEVLVMIDKNLGRPLEAAVTAIPARVMETLDPEDVGATIGKLYPVVCCVVKEVGLPWQMNAKEYNEKWHEQFRPFIEGQASEHHLHPYAVESFGTALRKELEKVKDTEVQNSWEHLFYLLSSARLEEPE